MLRGRWEEESKPIDFERYRFRGKGWKPGPASSVKSTISILMGSISDPRWEPSGTLSIKHWQVTGADLQSRRGPSAYGPTCTWQITGRRHFGSTHLDYDNLDNIRTRPDNISSSLLSVGHRFRNEWFCASFTYVPVTNISAAVLVPNLLTWIVRPGFVCGSVEDTGSLSSTVFLDISTTFIGLRISRGKYIAEISRGKTHRAEKIS